MISSSLHKRFSHCLANAQMVAFFFSFEQHHSQCQRRPNRKYETKNSAAWQWLFAHWFSEERNVCASAKQQRWTSKLIFSFTIRCSSSHPVIHPFIHSFTSTAPYTYATYCLDAFLFCRFFPFIFLFQFDFIFFHVFVYCFNTNIYFEKQLNKKCMVIITGMNTSSVHK